MKHLLYFLKKPLRFLVAFLFLFSQLIAWEKDTNNPKTHITFSYNRPNRNQSQPVTVDMRGRNSFSNNYNTLATRNSANTFTQALAVMAQSLENAGFQLHQEQNVVVQNLDMQQIMQLVQHYQDYLQRPEWQLRRNILDSRIDAIQHLQAGNSACITKSYVIGQSTYAYLKVHNIDTDSLKTCNGDILQQAIHNEFVALLDYAALIWGNQGNIKEVEQLTDIIIDFIDAGIASNKAGDVVHASMLSDACWSVLDCAQALAEGLVDGVVKTVSDIAHPIRTAQNIAETIITGGYYIGKLAVEVGDFGYLVVAEHPDKIQDKWDLWAETFGIIGEAIRDQSKNIQLRDAIKETTSFGIQLFLTPKALSGLSKFFGNAHKSAIRFADHIRRGAQESAVLATSEGILVRIADSAVEYMKNGKLNNFSVEKIITVVKKFTTTELTEVAKKLNFKKTNYRSHNQPVFKKGNRYITPDVDSHNGGVWKMADSVENLAKKQTRMGTYDINLNRIGE